MTELAQHMKEVALAVLGEPDDKRKQEWRYGTNGSLCVDTDAGTWYDFENETHGGVLDLIMRECGRETRRSAMSWLKEKGFVHDEPAARATKPKQQAKVVQSYDYIDEYGQLRYQVCRMEPKSFRQRRPEGAGWNWSVKGVTPLPYRLPHMLAKPNATVIVVEGEKDADNVAELGLVASCNSGGAGKFDDALVPYFKGRKVVIVEDNDEAGRNHSQVVARKLWGVADSVRVVRLPGLGEKEDVSDWIAKGGTKDDLVVLSGAADPWAPPIDEPDDAKPVEAFSVPPTMPDTSDDAPTGRPFIALGYDAGSYYYLPRSSEQVVQIKAAGHASAPTLLQLAPLEWWEVTYPKEKGGTDWNLAASDLMRKCESRGVYSLKNVRGRGAWYDKGASVLHLGDRLIVDNVVKQISEHHSQYIYTRQAPTESEIAADPATDEEAKAVFDICQRFYWENKVHGWLFAGFVVLAPICGALKWRPHVWITAQRGAGKSWLQENVALPLMGRSALTVQGGTTEAGIRQSLKSDARPIIFDEAESENQSAQRRMGSVLELARQASSDGSAEVAKGTVDGSGMGFRTRSMFMLGSVNVSLTQAADESRFSVLTLERPPKTPQAVQDFKALEREVARTLSTDACASIRARTYKLIPVIRQNAQTMAQAVAEELGSQRIGDQIGTLLAGAISLSRSDAISLEDARIWAKSIDLTEAKEAEETSDEVNCIQAMMQTQVRFDFSKGSMQRTLGELVMAATGKKALENDIYQAECNDILQRFGMVVRGDQLVVSNTHAELKRIMRDGPWGSGWARVLKRLDGASSLHQPVSFAGSRSRATSIPLREVI